MRKLVLIAAAAAALSFATPTQAQDLDHRQVGPGAVVGGTAGAWTGGTIGFFLGGPIGAIIGGTTGAVVGGAAGSTVDNDRYGARYDSRYGTQGGYGVGDVVGDEIRLRKISGETRYGYFRAQGRVYVVDTRTREIVEIRRG